MAAIELRTEIPGPRSRALMAERFLAVARGPFQATPIFVERAHGARLQDADGNTLLDFAAGIGVVNTGHTPETTVRAITEQATKLLHGSFNVTPYELYVRVCERLNAMTPGAFPKKSFLANSGAEAVENAIKIARYHTHRQAIVCFDHAFHGRTQLAMTLTAKAKPYKQGFGPFAPEIYRAPFPYAYRWATGSDPERVAAECYAELEELVTGQLGASEIAAIIIEPVLGEGGFIPASASFLARVRQLCTTHGIVLIADEIQTGFGRTGTLFACEQLSLVPDLIVTAKGLAGGMPLSAVTGRAEIMDAPVDGGIGGTFGGNPLACAAALATFDLFADGTLLAHARALGQTIKTRLHALQQRHPRIGEVRGLGPMLAIELVKDPASKAPDAELTKAIAQHCYERGLVIMKAGSHSNVIRLLMPLVITPAELEEGLDILAGALEAHAR